MTATSNIPPIKLAVLQRVCAPYRVPFFSSLSSEEGMQVRFFIGDDVPESKVKNASDFKDIDYRKLKTKFPRIGSRVLSWQPDLIRELRQFKPDVILCEAESHFLGYLQAITYRHFFNRRAALMHWCFISLPGWPAVGGTGFRALVKRFFRNFFDAFVVYSSFSKSALLKLGQPTEKIFVATNVGDVRHWLKLSGEMPESRTEARAALGLPQKFTVLYTGTLDEVKRPEVMLELAATCDPAKFNFVLLGSGGMLEGLRSNAVEQQLANVFLPGRVVNELALYYRAADVLLIPGRGGIVISEAMAFGLPVIVHEADGTEFDLVQNGLTGVRLRDGRVTSFREALESLANDPEKCSEMGRVCLRLVKETFTTENMVRQIRRAAEYARDSRNKHFTEVKS
jgi:glycosyltransferase involved in cell wall biosynthesis